MVCGRGHSTFNCCLCWWTWYLKKVWEKVLARLRVKLLLKIIVINKSELKNDLYEVELMNVRTLVIKLYFGPKLKGSRLYCMGTARKIRGFIKFIGSVVHPCSCFRLYLHYNVSNLTYYLPFVTLLVFVLT